MAGPQLFLPERLLTYFSPFFWRFWAILPMDLIDNSISSLVLESWVVSHNKMLGRVTSNHLNLVILIGKFGPPLLISLN